MIRPAFVSISRFGRTSRQGYSLTELALTLAIIAVLAAVAMPRFARSSAASRADAAAATVASLIEAARGHAVATSTTVQVTFLGGSVEIAVIDPTTNTETAVDDLLASRPQAEDVTTIGDGGAVDLSAEERETKRARRAALLAIQERTETLSEHDSTGTASQHALPWGATITSAAFGGDNVLIFNGHGIPDSGGLLAVELGGASRNVSVGAGGAVSISG